MTGVLVIGTGRSGTSLLMQAFGLLGGRLPDDAVPATEDNLRGTGESVAVRDKILALHRSLGMELGFRPDDWSDVPIYYETLDWMAGYLSDQESTASDAGFAIKFPLGSIFLPLWQAASVQSGVPLQYIWSTRSAPQTLRSLQKTYGFDDDASRSRWMQRIYYLLRDAPPDTLLLPFEGWARDPQAQITALAKQIGVTDLARLTAAERAFSTVLDHSDMALFPQDVSDFDKIAKRADDMIGKQLCPLSDRVDRDDVDYLRLMTRLSDAIVAQDVDGTRVISPDEHEMRLALLSRMAETSDAETPEMKQEIGVLSERIRSVTQRNKELDRVAKRVAAQPAGGNVPAKNTTSHDARQDANAARQGADTAQAEAKVVKASYIALQQSYDALEETILHRYRQQTEAQIAEADRHKRTADIMRGRVQKAKDVQERHLEEREKSRATIKALKAKITTLEARHDDHLKEREKSRKMIGDLRAGGSKVPNAGSAQTKARIEKQNNLISGLRAQLKAAQAKIDALQASRSWRVTAPLRALKGRGAAKAAPARKTLPAAKPDTKA